MKVRITALVLAASFLITACNNSSDSASSVSSERTRDTTTASSVASSNTAASSETSLSDNNKDDKVVIFGKYAGEPLEWIVLDNKDGKTLLLTKYVIEAKNYHDKEDAEDRDSFSYRINDWKNCTLRYWLNSSFYQSFSDNEKKAIQQTRNLSTTTSDNQRIEVDDYVFLLTNDEVKQYFKNTKDGIGYATEHAKSGILTVQEDDSCCWWLLRGNYVLNSGFPARGHNYKSTGIGVRPAIWVSSDAI